MHNNDESSDDAQDEGRLHSPGPPLTETQATDVLDTLTLTLALAAAHDADEANCITPMFELTGDPRYLPGGSDGQAIRGASEPAPAGRSRPRHRR